MQLGLPFQVAATRCLSTTESLRDFLRWTADEVSAAIESGTIPHAWDLRTPGAERAEIRVWHPTIAAIVASAGRDTGPATDADTVLAQVIPARDVRSSELERWWSCSHQHVGRLIAAGLLPVRRGPAAAAGPESYHLLAADGVRAFLAERLLCASPIVAV